MICGVKDKITINQVSVEETITKDFLSNKALKSLILFRRLLVFNSKYLKKLEEQSDDSAGPAVDELIFNPASFTRKDSKNE